jgi:hypothetical protein
MLHGASRRQNVNSLVDQGSGNREADAPRCAGHDGNLPLE